MKLARKQKKLASVIVIVSLCVLLATQAFLHMRISENHTIKKGLRPIYMYTKLSNAQKRMIANPTQHFLGKQLTVFYLFDICTYIYIHVHVQSCMCIHEYNLDF